MACSRGPRQMELIRELIDEGYAEIRCNNYGRSEFGYASVTETSLYGLRERLENVGFSVNEDWDTHRLSVSFTG